MHASIPSSWVGYAPFHDGKTFDDLLSEEHCHFVGIEQIVLE